MAVNRSFEQFLIDAEERYGAKPSYQNPVSTGTSSRVGEWGGNAYQQFLEDLEKIRSGKMTVKNSKRVGPKTDADNPYAPKVRFNEPNQVKSSERQRLDAILSMNQDDDQPKQAKSGKQTKSGVKQYRSEGAVGTRKGEKKLGAEAAARRTAPKRVEPYQYDPEQMSGVGGTFQTDEYYTEAYGQALQDRIRKLKREGHQKAIGRESSWDEETKKELDTLQGQYAQWEADMYREDQVKALSALTPEELKTLDEYILLRNAPLTLGLTIKERGERNRREAELQRELIQKYGGTEFARLVEYRGRQVNEILTRQNQEALTEAATKDGLAGFGAAALSVLQTYMAGPMAALDTLGQTAASKLGLTNPHAPIDFNAPGFQIQNEKQAIRDAQRQEILGDNPTDGRQALAFLYDTIMSSLDSVAAATLPGGSGAFLLSSAAGADSIRTYTENGATTEQALTMGLASAVAEWAFERISISNFKAMQEITPENWFDYLVNIAKSATVNFSEEALTEAANVLFDMWQPSNISEWKKRVRELTEQLMKENDLTQEEAERIARETAAKEFGDQIAMAGLGGMLQGVLMGGSGLLLGAVRRDPMEMTPRTLRQNQERWNAEMRQQNATIREGTFNAARLQTQQDGAENPTGPSEAVPEERGGTRERQQPGPLGRDAEADAVTTTAAANGMEQAQPEITTGAELFREEQEAAKQAREIIEAIRQDGTSPADQEAMLQQQVELWRDSNPDLADALESLWNEGYTGNSETGAVPETMQNGEGSDNGNGVRGSGERNGRADTGRESGSVAEGTGQNPGGDGERDVQARLADERRNKARNSGKGSQSTREALNLRRGSGTDSVYVPTEDQWDDEIRKIYRDAAANGYDYTPVVGVMHILTRDGQTVAADGYETNGRLYGRIDHNTVSATVFANHEMFHAIAKDNPGLVDAICEEILSAYPDEDLDGFVDAYAQAYRGAGLSRDQIMEEICADVYAQRSRFGVDLTGETGAVRALTNERTDTMAIGTRGETEMRAGPTRTVETERSGLELPDENGRYVSETRTANDREDEADRLSIADEDEAQLTERLQALDQKIAELEDQQDIMEAGEYQRQWYNAAMERAAVRSQLQDLRNSAKRANERARSREYARKNDSRDQHRENARHYREEARTAEAAFRQSGNAADQALAENYRSMAEKEQKEANRIGRDIRRNAAKTDVRARPSSSIRNTADRIMNLFHIQAGYRNESRAILSDILTRSLEQGRVGNEEIRDVIERLYETGVEVVPPSDTMFEDVAQYVRGKTVYVSPELRQEFGDNWKNFRSQLFGLGLYTSGDIAQMGVDSMYQELSGQYPGVFDEDETDMRTMLENVADVARRGRSEHISLGEAAERMGISREEDFEAMYDLVQRELDNFAEKAGLETDVRDWANRTIQEANERNREQIQAVREHRDQKIQEAYQHFRSVMDRQAERRAKAEADLKLRRAVERLRRRAKVNDQTLTRVIAEQTPAVQEAARRALEQLDTLANKITGKKRLSLTELKNVVLERQANDPNFEKLKPGTEAALKRLDQIRLNELSVEDVEAMRDAVNRISHDLETADRMISEAWDQQVAEVAEQVKSEVDFAKGDRRTGRARELFNEESLSPSRALLRYVGYDRDSAMGRLVQGLEKGNIDEMGYQLGAGLIFEDFLKNKKNQEWMKKAAGKDAETVKVEVPTAWLSEEGDVPLFEDMKKGLNTTEIEITQMMLVQMARDLQNEQNMRHVLYGGYTLPDMDLYRKGKIRDAYTLSGKKTVRMPAALVRQLVDEHLQPEGLAYAKLLDQYYDSYSKEMINAVSRRVDGVDRAITRHYSPIRTDTSFRGKAYNVFDGTLEGMGSLKNRLYYAKTPVRLEDADRTMRWHVDNMARYVGYAVPLRDLKAVLAYKQYSNSETIEGHIGEKWGDTSKRFISDLIQLIETGELNGKGEDVFSKLTGGYVRRILMYNISSAAKQLAALPLAGASLGQGSMANALLHKPASRELIRKYSPYLAYRGEGFTYAELADWVRNLDGKRKSEVVRALLGENWLDKVDELANRYLWNAAEHVVRKQYGDYLKPGTQAEIDAGTDPFYQKVAEVFNRATFDTQTNANTMSKPLVLARHNHSLQSFTMFKTDALQLQGIAREAFGAWRTARRQYAANQTQENQDKLNRAKGNLKKAAVGIILSSFIQALLGLAAKRLRGDDDSYKDEEGNLTLESAGKAVLKDSMQNMIGSVIFGDQVMEAFDSLFLDERLWEPDIPSVTTLFETFEKLHALWDDVGESVGESIQIARDQNTELTVGSYLDMQRDRLLGDLRAAAYELSAFVGKPIKNMEKTLFGILGHAFPELKVWWGDQFKEYARSDMKNLKGEELSASINAYLTDVIGETNGPEVEELRRLYEQFGNDALPGKNPPEAATTHESAQWEFRYRENMRVALDSVFGSGEYRDQTDEQRVWIVSKANDYAGGITTRDIMDKEPAKWIRETETAYSLGVALGDTFAVLYFKQSLKGTGDGQKDQVLEYIDSLNYSTEQKDAIYYVCNYGQSTLEKAPWN